MVTVDPLSQCGVNHIQRGNRLGIIQVQPGWEQPPLEIRTSQLDWGVVSLIVFPSSWEQVTPRTKTWETPGTNNTQKPHFSLFPNHVHHQVPPFSLTNAFLEVSSSLSFVTLTFVW